MHLYSRKGYCTIFRCPCQVENDNFICASVPISQEIGRFDRVAFKQNKTDTRLGVCFVLAEAEGFEPPWGCPQTVFKTRAHIKNIVVRFATWLAPSLFLILASQKTILNRFFARSPVMTASNYVIFRDNKSDIRYGCRFCFGGGRGIRTPVGLPPNGFQDRLVMTASICLRVWILNCFVEKNQMRKRFSRLVPISKI